MKFNKELSGRGNDPSKHKLACAHTHALTVRPQWYLRWKQLEGKICQADSEKHRGLLIAEACVTTLAQTKEKHCTGSWVNNRYLRTTHTGRCNSFVIPITLTAEGVRSLGNNDL